MRRLGVPVPEQGARESFELFLESIELRFRAGDVDADAKHVEKQAVATIEAMYADVVADLMQYPRHCLELPRLEARLAPDCIYEWHSPVMPPFAGRRVGKEAVYEQILGNFAALDDQRPVMKKIVAQGNDVAVFLHETGRLRMGGHAYTADIVQLFTLENDLVARFQTYGHMEIHER